MTMEKARQLCTFVIDELLFGVEVVNVQEVLRFQSMTKIPLASTVIRGLINLRGQIVTAIDMRARLGLAPLGDAHRPLHVVMRPAAGVVSLLVDEIGDVLSLDEHSFERAPETLSGVFREVVLGVYKLEGELLLLLDVERIIALGELVEQTHEPPHAAA